MSETKGSRRADRAASAAAGQIRNFALAVHGDNVLLVETTSGRSWALASDDGELVWHPIVFRGPAERAPRGPRAAREEQRG